ncbi:MAG: TonB-dependent receptor [Ignavibacteriae bacterium]|nr:MAG: TonB-dependent receptor [Ignavibacteriota bacterium]
MKILPILFLLFAINFGYAQTGAISGNVTDANTEQGLQDAAIYISNLDYKVFTDKIGHFLIQDLPAGKYDVMVSYLGYKKETFTLNVLPDTVLRVQFKIDQSSITLGEIIVTSFRHEQQLKNIPLPVEVVDNSEITQRNPVSASDLMKNKAGVTLTRDGIWATDINIRGMNRSSIVTLVDGNRIETATDISARLSLFDINDIERIEIIKGGMSSLYGTGALGGVVNIITKSNLYAGKFTFSGKILSDYNSVNNSTGGNLLLYAGAERWFLKLNGTMRKAGNIKTPNSEINNSGFKDNYFSGVLGVNPFRNNEIKINYQYYLAKDVGIPGGYPLFPNNALVTYPKEERSLLSAEYKISQISKILKDVSAKFYYQYIFRDVENIPHIVQKVYAGNVLKKKVSVLNIKPQADHNTKGFSLQSGWLLGKYNFVIAGFDAWQRDLDSRRTREQVIEDYDSTGTVVIKTIKQVTGERPIPISSYRSIGAFAQDEIRLFKDKLKINIGGRIDQIKVTNDIAYNPEYTITNDTGWNWTPAGQKIIWNSAAEDDISWSANVGAMYALYNDVSITFNAARSFRSPSLEERYQYIDLGSLVRLGNPDLNPENGIFLDAGFKVFNPVIKFTGSGFLNTINDLVIEIPGTYENRQAMIKTNAGKSRFYGFDANLEYNFYKKFVFYSTVSYVRGRDIENDLDLPQIPPLNGSIGLKAAAGKYANLDFSVMFFARQNKIAAGEVETPGYVTLNLYVQSMPIKFSGVKINLYGGIENILDKEYRNHLSTNRGTITQEPGRNFFAKIGLSW